MHYVGILHRDLKLANIILVDGVPCIVDFGLSAQMVLSASDARRKSPYVITVNYRPPELLYQAKSHLNYSYEIDIWSLACIILELLTGVTPFHLFDYNLKYKDEQMLQVITSILGTPPKDLYPYFSYSEDYAPRLNCIQTEGIRSLLLDMLNYRPKERPAAQDCYEHLLVSLL